MASTQKTISEARLKSLLAAEAFCQAAREAIASGGFVGNKEFGHLDRWMRLTGKRKYARPKRLAPVWCYQCKRRHVYGEHHGKVDNN
jgi:hypothetical protein